MIQNNPKRHIKSQPGQVVNHSVFFVLKQLYRFINYFGLSNGIKLFLKVKSNRLESILLPNYAHPFEMRAHTTDIHMFNQIYFNQCYDLAFQFDPKVIIDAGANIGLASIFFANRFPKAMIISIEPQTENFEMLTKNTLPYENINLLNTALWKNSDLLLINDIGNGESGYITSPSDSEKGICSTTINQICQTYALKCIDILKIDIEGSEKEVFEYGFEFWLPKTRCLIVETHDIIKPGSSKSVFKAIVQYNFRTEIHGENLIFYNCDLV